MTAPLRVIDECVVCGVELGLGLTMVRRALAPLNDRCLECAQFAHSTPDEFIGDAP